MGLKILRLGIHNLNSLSDFYVEGKKMSLSSAEFESTNPGSLGEQVTLNTRINPALYSRMTIHHSGPHVELNWFILSTRLVTNWSLDHI